jgi:hypothetical protein
MKVVVLSIEEKEKTLSKRNNALLTARKKRNKRSESENIRRMEVFAL